MNRVAHSQATARIQRRLERLELHHLREHAAELAERLDAAEKRAADAEERARFAEHNLDFWHDQAIEMHQAMAEESGGVRGITMDGTLVILPTADAGRAHA